MNWQNCAAFNPVMPSVISSKNTPDYHPWHGGKKINNGYSILLQLGAEHVINAVTDHEQDP